MTEPNVPILLADDNELMPLFLKSACLEAGIHLDIHWVQNGQKLMDYLRKSKIHNSFSHPRPALILLDLNMPGGKNGKEVLKELKQDKVLKDIPVVILTRSEVESDVEALIKMGAEKYIQKPAVYRELIHAIEEINELIIKYTH